MQNFEPRKWQRKAVGDIRAIARDGSDRALVYACPGSGKTYGGLLIARALIDEVGKGPKIIVVTPNLAIKSQWIDRAAKIGIRLKAIKSGSGLEDELGFEETGFILTYQQVISLRHSLRLFCETQKPIVILDEIHHTEGRRAEKDGNVWGHMVEFAFASASFKLCTTGTPFREGNNPISFVRYHDDQTVVCNVSYPYSQALIDRICRPIEFGLIDGDISWMDKGHPVTASFEVDIKSKEKRARRLAAALSTDGEQPRNLLIEANRKLVEIRSGSSPADRRAAGLVVAIDKAHARDIAVVLEEVSGAAPLVVHSEIDKVQWLINNFRDGDAPWIVGVQMLSEGVDIPRLRVGAYLSDIRKALFFHQFCGRFSRKIVPESEERSFVYLPADPELTALATTINIERAHALGEDVEAPIPRIGAGGGRASRNLTVLGSDGKIKFYVIGQDRFPVSFVDHHRPAAASFRKKDETRTNMSDLQVIRIMLDLGVIQPPAEAAE